MEVSLRPPLHGCLIALLGLMTLGLYPLLRRMMERRFIRRVKGVVNGVVMSDELLLETRRGRVSLALWRAGNADEALDYLLRRLPGTVARG